MPILKAWINDGGARSVTGQDYVLTCGITGAENLSPNITYQWTKDSGQGENRIQVGTNFNSTSFSPLQLSDARQYTCHIIVQSPYIYKEMVVTVSQNVTLESKSRIVSHNKIINLFIILLLQSWLHYK